MQLFIRPKPLSPSATIRPHKKKTDEDKLDNHHDDPDCMVNKNRYKVVWRELKKQAKRIVSSKADADSSSDESVSFDSCGTRRPSDSTWNNFEEHVVSNENLSVSSSEGVEVNNKSRKRDKYCNIEPSVQAGMILESNCVYTYPLTPAVSSHVGIQNQIKKVLPEGKTNTKSAGQIADIKSASQFTGTKTEGQRADTKPAGQFAGTKTTGRITNTKSASQITGTKPAGQIANTKSAGQIIVTITEGQITDTKPAGQIANTKSASQITGTKSEDQRADAKPAGQIADTKTTGQIANTKGASQITGKKTAGQIADTKHAGHIANIKSASQITGKKTEGQIVDTKPAGQITDTEGASQIADTKTPDQIRELMLQKEEHQREKQNVQMEVVGMLEMVKDTKYETNEKYSYIKELQGKMMQYKEFEACGETKYIVQLKGREATRLMPDQTLSILSDDWIYILPDEVRRKFINRSKSVHPEDSFTQFKLLDDIRATADNTGEEPVEDSVAHFKLLDEITTKTKEKPEEDSLADFTLLANITTDKTGEKPTEVSLTQLKLLYQITTLLTKTGETPIEPKNASAGERSEHESARIRVYRNVIRNETRRMMTSIDMVVSEAERLFGHERTQIFFNLLDDELFHFGSAGASPGFIPNMTESTVRQHVISFFEHSCDVTNRLMALLLGCPDRERLQQMPEQNFMSLMQSVIHSSIQTATKGGKKLSLKENTLIMVDSKEFERALGEEIPEDVLDKLRRGEEMVAHRFVDTKIGRTQASERRENSQICFIYFPLDCQLFIYIPTEKGSYWHRANMQRENRIRQLDK